MTMRVAADAAAENEKEGERGGKAGAKEKGVHVAHFPRESQRALEPERRNIRARFVRKWSVHV